MKLNSLDNYKLALKLNKDIDKVLSILSSSISQLDTYKYLSSVNCCLESLNDAKLLLDLHNNNYKRIIKNKGLVE